MISMYDRVGLQGCTLAEGKAFQVTEPVPEGPAQKAGILANDLVIKVKGHESPSEAFASAEVGTVLFLEVIRAGAGHVSQSVVIPVPVTGRSRELDIRTVEDIARILCAPQLLQALSKEVQGLAVHDGSVRPGETATPPHLQAALWQFIPNELTRPVTNEAVAELLQHHAARFGGEGSLLHLTAELLRLVEDCNAPHVLVAQPSDIPLVSLHSVCCADEGGRCPLFGAHLRGSEVQERDLALSGPGVARRMSFGW